MSDASLSWRQMVGRTLDAAQWKYCCKYDEYGESWKEMPIPDLRDRLYDEMAEWYDVQEDEGDIEYQELIDVINVACMLAERVRTAEEGKEGR